MTSRQRQELLTRRELIVLALVQRGLTNSEIAARPGVSEGTAHKLLESLYGKKGPQPPKEPPGRPKDPPPSAAAIVT
ncbi:MAG TPA: LuxR C-terminal-related transcriptional regulator [Candidatus Dormibacteraeota bacterium]|nr:LuxR C-terminal-related transcriptional regulator [Candidatus Dormibacteraeota bacterium]